MATPAATWQSNPPEQLLKERFHIKTGFQAGQRDIIEQLVQGKRLLVIQRTGWGKSLCYQMASFYYPHLTLVFSPLKALMRDQCQRCNDCYGMAAGIVSSEFSLEENRTTLARAIEGELNILFIAPERLDNADWQSSVPQMRISMIVIDEAHCIANQYKVVCSTNALGMGIDKPDIRFVIHYQIPASPIHYYQEIGRAGRDTKVSWCVLLYEVADLAIQEHFNRTAKPEAKCYDFIMSLLQVIPQGLHDLMQLTGYAQTVVEHILFDLQEQHLVERNAKERTYTAVPSLAKVDFAAYDSVREQKKRELKDMQEYAQLRYCYMEYLTTYLGNAPGYTCRTCGNCRSSNFPVVKYPERIHTAAARFLEEEYLPRIEKRGTSRRPEHEAGWSLSYHGGTRVGKLVRASKYEDAGPFPLSLLTRAVEIIRTHYPLQEINGIVSVPPTKSGMLVETFERRVAEQLALEYVPIITKVRETYEQKSLTNWVQKKENVKAAFSVSLPQQVVGRSFLLIDDIYDSGYMLREVGRTLMQAGAKAVYPFTITHTAHSDDQ